MNRKNVCTLIGGMFFISAAYTMLVPFLPLYLIELGVTGDDVKLWNGMVFSVCFFVAGIMGPVWGETRRYARQKENGHACGDSDRRFLFPLRPRPK